MAGFSCCVAMSMPQVHLVAYCGDPWLRQVARGAQMLSLMLFLGIASRVGSGFVVADEIGASATPFVSARSAQAVALLLYMYFDGLTSLFVVSGLFGLFQGGIVPMYAIICREPGRCRRAEAGAKINLVVGGTIFGMAFGGYISGVIFDATHSYRDGVRERRIVERPQPRRRRLAALGAAAAVAGASPGFGAQDAMEDPLNECKLARSPCDPKARTRRRRSD